MASAFDDLAQNVQAQSDTPTMVTDFLGRQAPLALSGQPVLPTGTAVPTPATGPAGPGGIGVGAGAPKSSLLEPPTAPTGDVLGGTQPAVGGEGSGGGTFGAAGLNSSVDVTGGTPPSFSIPGTAGHVALGPTGTLSVKTGDAAVDFAVNQALSFGLGKLGGSLNIASLISLLGLPGFHAFAGAVLGPAGLGLDAFALANMLGEFGVHALGGQTTQDLLSETATVASTPELGNALGPVVADVVAAIQAQSQGQAYNFQTAEGAAQFGGVAFANSQAPGGYSLGARGGATTGTNISLPGGVFTPPPQDFPDPNAPPPDAPAEAPADSPASDPGIGAGLAGQGLD